MTGRISLIPWRFVLGAVFVLANVAGVRAQDPRLPTIIDLRIGFEGKDKLGRYKLGQWTPVEITLVGGTQTMTGLVTVEVPDGDGVPSEFVTPRPIQVLPGAKTSALLYAKIGRTIDEMPVTFLVGGREVAKRRFHRYVNLGEPAVPEPLDPAQKLYLLIGPPIGIDTKLVNRQPSPNPQAASQVNQAEVVELQDAGQLPTQWYGYEAVDALIISTSEPGSFRQLTDMSAALQALKEWVESGGKLILCSGSQSRDVLGADAPLATFAPGPLADVVTLRRGAALESFSGATSRIPPMGRGDAINLQVPRFDRIDGVVLAEEGDVPLIVRSPRAFGEVLFVGVDLDRRPFSDWQGRGRLVARLLEGPRAKETGEGVEAVDAMQSAAQYGIQDLAGQLRGALDQFEGITVVPFWIVGLLVFGYIVLVGPGDFLLVKKVIRRMEFTWITFPTMVVTVSLGAYALAYLWKGDELTTNQVDLVDVDTSQGLVRGTTWSNVFSPATASYNMTLRPRVPGLAVASPNVLLSWLGLPGTGWNGMQTGGGQGLFNSAYAFSPKLNRLEDVPIDVWSTKSFIGRWNGKLESSMTGELVCRRRASDTLEGNLNSDLPFALTDCVLVYGHWAWKLSDIPAEGAIRLSGNQSDRQDLATFLRQSQVVKQDNNSLVRQAIPYDPAGFDVPTILSMMMFYRASDASPYTGLPNDYQAFVDQSRQLDLGRAVLVGRVHDAAWASQLEHNGQSLAGPHDRRWVFYRFLLPVRQAD
jgi:hypothetical protein